MAEKLYKYEGFVGRLHGIRSNITERWSLWKESHSESLGQYFKDLFVKRNESVRSNVVYEDFSHLYRRKTRRELVRISAAVTGIEFSYAAETAFVSPTLLKIGVEHKHMTLVWALSPLIGFFLTPILGSLSDRCDLQYGRRRPFMFIMSLGVLFGLILVPNGELLGYTLGDTKPINVTHTTVLAHRFSSLYEVNSNDTVASDFLPEENASNYHPWGIFFTILGTVLLDFDADACQSPPARAYLLDVTISGICRIS